MRVERWWLAAAGFFALAGGAAGLVTRAELARPGLQMVVGQESFGTALSVHATVSLALVAVPLAIGLAHLVLRPPAHRAGTVAPVVFVAGGLLTLEALLDPGPAQYGWFSYEPVPAQVAPGRTLSAAGLALVALAAVIALPAVLLAVRGATVRAGSPFATAVAAAGTGALLVVPVIVARLAGLAGERTFSFDDAVLPDRLVGVVGAPDVLLVVLPFLGVVGQVLARATGGPLAAPRAWAVATWAAAALAVAGVYAAWLLPADSGVTGWASVLAGVAVAVLVGCWGVTLRRGLRGLPPPALVFAGGAVLALVLGGISGLVLLVPDLLVLTDTTFVAAHQQEAFYGPILFGGFAGLYRWWPRLTGRRLPYRLGWLHAGLTVVGFQLVLLPQFWLGTLGMPARYADYLPEDGFSAWQGLSAVGAVVLAVSVVPFVVGVLRSRPVS